MVFNEFRHVAGELGIGFSNAHSVRVAFFNVALSERHLSSGEASVVDGENVEGLWRGVDLYYDYPVARNIYLSPSVGYHDNRYTHTVLGTSVRHASPAAGFAVSYLGDSVFGEDRLYWRFSLAFNYYFEDQEDTILGDSTVNGVSFGMTPAIFVGYAF